MKKTLLTLSLFMFIIQGLFSQNPASNIFYQLEYCKIWGLVKYYHPDASKNKKDIDQIFLDLYPEMTSLQDDVSFNKFIAKFMGHFKDMNADKLSEEEYKAVLENQLEKTKKFSFLKDSVSYYSNLDFSWLKESPLTPELKKKVVAILVNSPPKKLENMSNNLFGPGTINEAPSISDKNINAEYSTMILFKQWNIIDYLYPYKHLLDQPWEKAFLETYQDFNTIRQRSDFMKALYKLIALTQDNHSGVTDWAKYENLNDYKSYPFEMQYSEGKIVVYRILNKSFCENNVIRPGDIIHSINGQSIKGLIDSLGYLVPYSIPGNFHDQLMVYMNQILLPDTIQVSFSGIEVSPKTIYRMPMSFQEYEAIYHPSQKYKIMEGNIAYIKNPVMSSKKEEREIFAKIKDCSAVIVDFRRYKNRGIMSYLIPRLADKAKKVGTSFVKVSNLIGFYKRGYTSTFASGLINGMSIKAANYPSNVVVLIGNDDVSAMETECMIAKVYAPQAVFIGTNTAGADGFIGFIKLTDQISVKYVTTNFAFADGTPIQRKGIQPDIEVRPTIQGIREGRDEVLERAIEYIRNGK